MDNWTTLQLLKSVSKSLNKYKFLFFIFLATSIYSAITLAQEKLTKDPCSGDSALLALIDRPSVQDSSCVLNINQVILEVGAQYNSLTSGHGNLNYPELELRLGLPEKNEIFLLLPNYYQQDGSGFGATSAGIKHEFFYTEKIILSAEGIFTLPSGGGAFGSAGFGSEVNGIVSYILSPTISTTLMLGFSTETVPSNAGGGRYNSFNPDLVVTWQPKNDLQFYGEVYGQSKISSHQGSGFNLDGGIQYLIQPFWEIDIEAGKRISGNLGGFNYYVGAGTGLLW